MVPGLQLVAVGVAAKQLLRSDGGTQQWAVFVFFLGVLWHRCGDNRGGGVGKTCTGVRVSCVVVLSILPAGKDTDRRASCGFVVLRIYVLASGVRGYESGNKACSWWLYVEPSRRDRGQNGLMYIR